MSHIINGINWNKKLSISVETISLLSPGSQIIERELLEQ
jgi:hypothetical protein